MFLLLLFNSTRLRNSISQLVTVTGVLINNSIMSLAVNVAVRIQALQRRRNCRV